MPNFEASNMESKWKCCSVLHMLFHRNVYCGYSNHTKRQICGFCGHKKCKECVSLTEEALPVRAARKHVRYDGISGDAIYDAETQTRRNGNASTL